MVIRKATRSQLAAQRDELLALRGGLTQEDWVKVLGVPIRTYHRYEMGTRVAPEVVMRLARLSTGGAGGVAIAAEDRAAYRARSKKKR